MVALRAVFCQHCMHARPVLFLQRYSTKCDFWKTEPCKNMKGDTYFWTPAPGLTWTLVASSIYAAIMVGGLEY